MKNVGNGDAINGIISDTLPTTVNLVGPVTLDPPNAGTLGTFPMIATNLFFTGGESITVTFPVTVDKHLAGVSIVNTAVVTSEQQPTVTGTLRDVNTINVLYPNLQIAKSATLSPTRINSVLTYTLTVTNVGPGLAHDIIITDTLPANVTFNSIVNGPHPSSDLDFPCQCQSQCRWRPDHQHGHCHRPLACHCQPDPNPNR